MCCVTLLTGSASVIRNERSLDNKVIDGLHVWLLNGAIFTHCVLILHAKRRKFLHRPLNILRSKSLCVRRNVQVTNDKRRFLAVGRRRIRVGRLWGRAAGSDIRRGEKKESDLLVAPNSDQRSREDSRNSCPQTDGNIISQEKFKFRKKLFSVGIAVREVISLESSLVCDIWTDEYSN